MTEPNEFFAKFNMKYPAMRCAPQKFEECVLKIVLGCADILVGSFKKHLNQVRVVDQKHFTQFFTDPKGLGQLGQRDGVVCDKIWHILEFQEVTGGQYLSKTLIFDSSDFRPDVIEYITREVISALGKSSTTSNRVQMNVSHGCQNRSLHPWHKICGEVCTSSWGVLSSCFHHP